MIYSIVLLLALPSDALSSAIAEADSNVDLVSVLQRRWEGAYDNPDKTLISFVTEEATLDPLLWREMYEQLLLDARPPLDPNSDYTPDDTQRLVVACAAISKGRAGRAGILRLATTPNRYQDAGLCALGLHTLSINERNAVLAVLKQSKSFDCRILAATILTDLEASDSANILRRELLRMATEACGRLPARIGPQGSVAPDDKAWHDLFTILQLLHCNGTSEAESLEEDLGHRTLPRGLWPPLRTDLVLNSRWGQAWLARALSDPSELGHYQAFGPILWKPRWEALRAVAEARNLPAAFFDGYLASFRERELPEKSTPDSELEDVLFLRTIIRNRATLDSRQLKLASRVVIQLRARVSSNSAVGHLRAIALRFWYTKPEGTVTVAELPEEASLLFEMNGKKFLSLFALCAEAGISIRLSKDEIRSVLHDVGTDILPSRLRSHLAIACREAGVESNLSVEKAVLASRFLSHDVLRHFSDPKPELTPAPDVYNIHRQAHISAMALPYRPTWIAVDGVLSREVPTGWPILHRR